jgi:hypothetical protein
VLSEPSGVKTDVMEFMVGGVLKVTQRNDGCTTHCEHAIEVTAADTVLTVKTSSSNIVASRHMVTEQWKFSCGKPIQMEILLSLFRSWFVCCSLRFSLCFSLCCTITYNPLW